MKVLIQYHQLTVIWLDQLDKIKIGLLTGELPKSTLQQLSHMIATHRDQGLDPKLAEILDEIDERVLGAARRRRDAQRRDRRDSRVRIVAAARETAQERRELLEVEDDLAGTPVLLVNPRVPLSTGPVFKAWDGEDRGALPEGPASTIARERAGV